MKHKHTKCRVILFLMEKFYDFSLREGSLMVVSGPTMCGKSTFVHALLNDKHMFSKAPARVYWFYGQATEELKLKKFIFYRKGYLTPLIIFLPTVLLY